MTKFTNTLHYFLNTKISYFKLGTLLNIVFENFNGTSQLNKSILATYRKKFRMKKNSGSFKQSYKKTTFNLDIKSRTYLTCTMKVNGQIKRTLYSRLNPFARSTRVQGTHIYKTSKREYHYLNSNLTEKNYTKLIKNGTNKIIYRTMYRITMRPVIISPVTTITTRTYIRTPVHFKQKSKAAKDFANDDYFDVTISIT